MRRNNMNKRIRMLIVLSVLCIAGALLNATPLFFEQQTSSTSSTFKFDMSYENNASHITQTNHTSDAANATMQKLVHVQDYGLAEQGSFFLQAQEKSGYLLSPLLDTKVDITITGLIARAVVTQEFSNPTQNWVNGIYAFPLPENAAVDQLAMQIGDRKIKGTIEPKKKAKLLYQQAKKAGKKASLLVQNRPNLFTNSVANIGPGEKITVTIEYQQSIKFDQGTFSLRFPTTITERYLPAKQNSEETVTVNQNGWGITQPVFVEDQPSSDLEQAAPMNKVAIYITLNTGFSLANIASESHPIIKSEIASGQYKVQLQQDMIANQDFILNWQAEPNNQPTAAHFTQNTNNSHYGMVMLMPPNAGSTAKPLTREVIFVVDTSGSMAGTSIAQAKSALSLAINDLVATDSFNIIQFNSIAKNMWPKPLLASPENKDIALNYVSHLQANGGTEMRSALQLALGYQSTHFNKDSERLRQVIFITDGSVGNETELFSYINKNLNHSRLFTVGIGSAPNSFFMTEAALMGKGTYTFVSTIDDVQSKMHSLFKKLTQPVLADVHLAFLQDVEVYPRNIPDLYQGEPLMISYRSNEPIKHMQATGSLHSQNWQQSIQLHNSGQQSGLDTLWARRKIAQLERDKYKGQDAATINQNILQLAIQHHLVSSMTSLVAIDVTPTALSTSKSSDVKNQQAKDRQVKNHRPLGQTSGVLPQTATPAALHLLLAALFMSIALCINFIAKYRNTRCSQ